MGLCLPLAVDGTSKLQASSNSRSRILHLSVRNTSGPAISNYPILRKQQDVLHQKSQMPVLQSYALVSPRSLLLSRRDLFLAPKLSIVFRGSTSETGGRRLGDGTQLGHLSRSAQLHFGCAILALERCNGACRARKPRLAVVPLLRVQHVVSLPNAPYTEGFRTSTTLPSPSWRSET